MMGNDKDQMHPDDLKNLLTFIVLAVLIWVLFDHFLIKPKVDALRNAQKADQQEVVDATEPSIYTELKPRAEIINDSPRVKIESDRLFGSIPLIGARIDDVSLTDYYKTMKKREHVVLFSPMGSYHPRYVSFGWASTDKDVKVPGKTDGWSVEGGVNGATLKPDHPVTLYWDNGHGLRFERTYAMDDTYLFTVTERVINHGDKSVTLSPYSLLAQHGLPEDLYGRSIIQEGPIGYINDELMEIKYKKMPDEKLKEIKADRGWIGLTERYWFTAMFPQTEKDNTFRAVYVSPEMARHLQERYQTDIMGAPRTIKPGDKTENVTRVYVGPKKLKILEAYGKEYGWHHIDLAIDFGMYYFLTKPLFYLLHWLGDVTGNFGIGIILLTIVVRLFVFPLANTSYRSFAKLRKVSPQTYKLREKYKDDKEKLQQALVKLYEKENVNPMAGCLPIVIQIPIFFALFKTLQISVEMRHAPFYGWIHDLSAPDPTSIFNLFGLLDFHPPAKLMIGAWPCMMLVFMILQKKMSPPPTDKTQKFMMDFMPFFIAYILSKYPVGLVIYWTFSNALSVVQQYIIMKSMGVEPHLFKTKEQKEKEKELAASGVHPGLEMIEEDVEEALFGDEEHEVKPSSKGKAKEKKPVSRPKPKKSKKKK